MAKAVKQTANEESGVSTEQAMNRVLEAECQAQQAVADYEKESEAQLQQARQQAHRIKQRTDVRIARIHQRSSRLITDEINRIQQGDAQERSHHQSVIDLETINTVAEKTAEELTT